MILNQNDTCLNHLSRYQEKMLQNSCLYNTLILFSQNNDSVKHTINFNLFFKQNGITINIGKRNNYLKKRRYEQMYCDLFKKF